jgi:hypothetical protein
MDAARRRPRLMIARPRPGRAARCEDGPVFRRSAPPEHAPGTRARHATGWDLTPAKSTKASRTKRPWATTHGYLAYLALVASLKRRALLGESSPRTTPRTPPVHRFPALARV